MLITSARPAAPLTLSEVPQIIADAGEPTKPCLLSIAGDSKLQLQLLNITATGWVDPKQAGRLTLILYGTRNEAHMEAPNRNIALWTQMAVTPPEQIGRPVDPEKTQWMMQGTRLMFYFGNGKMQGESLSNIADQPIPAVKLDNPLLGLQPNLDPVAYFAIAAAFTPDADPLADLQVVQMVNFTLSGEM